MKNEDLTIASDETLMNGVAKGDMHALGALYTRHASLLGKMATSWVGETNAQDLVHDAFASLPGRASMFDPARGSVLAWLVSAIKHRSIDDCRTNKRRRGLLEQWGGVDAQRIASTDTSNDHVLARQLVASAGLPEMIVATLSLVLGRGLTCAEAASAQGVPTGTVKSRMARALADLRGIAEGDTLSGSSDHGPDARKDRNQAGRHAGRQVPRRGCPRRGGHGQGVARHQRAPGDQGRDQDLATGALG